MMGENETDQMSVACSPGSASFPALAIVGAEYVLRWLEPGTHRWEQFVTPLELTGFARAAGLRRQSLRGMVYDPFRRDCRLSSDTAVNYLVAATKPEV
jgi:2-polyprenyl-6-hydroxyphenyl methylase / 3-demethylubiquinone-9 3-methyltransferase